MKLAETVKYQIEEKICPVHDMHPVVDATGEEISVACCCTYFEKYCGIEIEHLKSQISFLNSHTNGRRSLNKQIRL